MSFIDVHPLIITDDSTKYLRSSFLGIQSDRSRQRPVTIEDLIAPIHQPGIAKAVIGESSTCGDYDNRCLVVSVARCPAPVTAVGPDPGSTHYRSSGLMFDNQYNFQSQYAAGGTLR